jgi:hypothetical protein
LAWKSTYTPAQHTNKQFRDDLPGSRSAMALCAAVLGVVAGGGFCCEILGGSCARQPARQTRSSEHPVPIVTPSVDLGFDRRRFNRSKFIFAARLAGRERTNTQFSIFLSHLKTQKNCGQRSTSSARMRGIRRHHFLHRTIAI